MKTVNFKKIALLHSQFDVYNRADFELNPHGRNHMKETVTAVEKALCDHHYSVVKIPATFNLLNDLTDTAPDIIFNACSGIEKKSQQAIVAAMLEQLDIPFLGSGLSAHVFGLHKHVTKALFRLHNLPTADYQVFITGVEPLNSELKFPLIVKPVHEGSGIGISNDSVVFTEGEMRRQVKYVIEHYHQEALAERFLEGREFTIGIMGNDSEIEVLPIKEIEFNPDHKEQTSVQNYDIKAVDGVRSICPSRLESENPSIAKYLKDCASIAFNAVGCRDFARLDVRMDKEGNPFLLEINTLPGMTPGYSDFPQIAEAAGYQYSDLIVKLLEIAWKRYYGD